MAMRFKKGGRSILASLILVVFLASFLGSLVPVRLSFADNRQDIENKKKACEYLKVKVNTSSAINQEISRNTPEYEKCIQELKELEQKAENNNITPGAGGASGQVETSEKITKKNNLLDKCKDLNIQCDGSENIEDIEKKIQDKEAANAAENEKKEESEDEVNCAVQHLGWIICTVVNLLSDTMAAGYSILEQNFLVIKSNQLFSQSTPESKALYESWTRFRDIGNVIFAIIFIVVVFSQITGLGISSYGIKKILPRMMIYAILMNISWYICVIAVDISNILGVQLKELLTSASTSSNNLSSISSDAAQILKGSSSAAVGVDLAAGTAIAGTGAAAALGLVPFTASGLALFLVAGFFGLMTMLVILTLRQALVVVAVVVAPVAIAFGILPGTEDWFKKWQKTFKTLLLIYPIASGIAGASLMASSILKSAAGGNIFLQVIYALLPIFGMITTWEVIKKSLNFLGGLSNKVTSIGKTANAKTADGFSKIGLKDGLDNVASSAMNRLGIRRSTAGLAFAERQRQKANSREALRGQQARKLAAQNILDRNQGRDLSELSSAEVAQMAFAQSEVDKGKNEDVERIKALIKARGGNNPGSLKQALENSIRMGADGTQLKAIAELAEELGGGSEADILHQAIHNVSVNDPNALSTPAMKEFFTNLSAARGRDIKSKDAGLSVAVEAIAKGAFTSNTLSNAYSSESTYANLSPQDMASQNVRSRTHLRDNISKFSASSAKEIVNTINETENNPNLNHKLDLAARSLNREIKQNAPKF